MPDYMCARRALGASAAVHVSTMCSAVLSVLVSRPELALYRRVYEDPGIKEYLQRGTQGQQAAQV